MDATPAAAEPPRPATGGSKLKLWYCEPGLMISAAAFFISIVTTIMSIQREGAQDLNAKKDALHAAIQQHASNFKHKLEINKAWNIDLSELGFDFSKTEKDQGTGPPNPKIALILDGLKNFNANFSLETMTLSKQAHSLIDQLGPAATSVDLSDVAVLLGDAEVQDFPEQMFQQALDLAESSVEYLSAARGLAKARFKDGHIEQSQKAIDVALGVFDKFRNETHDEGNVHRTRLQTYLWAIGYLGEDGCPLTLIYLSNAQDELASLDRRGGDDAFGNQLSQLDPLKTKCEVKGAQTRN